VSGRRTAAATSSSNARICVVYAGSTSGPRSRTGGNPVAALSVSRLAFEFDKQLVADLIPLVLGAARTVTAALGGDATPEDR
jgi:hypothetical protein